MNYPPGLEYIEGSANQIPIVYQDNILRWGIIYMGPGQSLEITFDTRAVLEGVQINYANATEHGIFCDEDEVTVNVNMPIPNPYGSGSLGWTSVAPSSTQIGTIYVGNNGDTNSKLSWEICEYPNWGTWTFAPEEGEDLKPSDGQISIAVSVVAPDQQNAEYDGRIKLCNKENNEDYHIIEFTMTTPKNKAINSIFSKIISQFFPNFLFL